MKLFKIVVILIVLVSFFPVDAFSSMHQNSTKQHHCISVCGASCHSAIMPQHKSAHVSTVTAALIFSYIFAYDNPILPDFKKPPKVSS